MRQSRLRVLAALALVLAACGRPPPVGVPGEVRGFAGGVVADEANAATAAAAVLRGGGTAVDAAVALYFVLAVTHPAAAGLGGGGVCLNYHALTASAESVEFLPRRPAAGGAIAVPGSVRGLAALHGRYGRLPWGTLIEPAQRLARDGHRLARVAAAGLAAAGALRVDPHLRALFVDADGRPLAEGRELVQIELGAVLSQIMRRGATEIYGGGTGRLLVEASVALGGGLAMADLRAYQAHWRPAQGTDVGETTLYGADSPPLGSGVAIRLWQALAQGGWAEADAAGRQALVSTAMRQADGEGAATSVGAPGERTSFVVADRGGSAIACALALGGPLGSVGSAPPTGIAFAPVAAAAPDDLALVMAVRSDGTLLFTAVAAGDATGPAAVAQTGVAVLTGTPLERALALPRPVADSGVAAALRARVSALSCPEGLVRGPESCALAADAGHGLALLLDGE